MDRTPHLWAAVTEKRDARVTMLGVARPAGLCPLHDDNGGGREECPIDRPPLIYTRRVCSVNKRANVRRLIHRLYGWVERRLWSHHHRRADSCAPVVKSPIWVSRIVNSNPDARLVPGAR